MRKSSFYLERDFDKYVCILLAPNDRGAILYLKVHKRQPQKHSKQSRDVPAIHADSIYFDGVGFDIDGGMW